MGNYLIVKLLHTDDNLSHKFAIANFVIRNFTHLDSTDVIRTFLFFIDIQIME